MNESQTGDMVKTITYFEKMGRVNTDSVLRLAKERFDELNLKHVLVATSWGEARR